MNLYCSGFLFSPSAPSCHTAIKTFKLEVFLLASVDIEFMLLQYKSNQFKSQFQEKEVWTALVLEERATKSNWKLTPIFLPPQFSWGGGEGGRSGLYAASPKLKRTKYGGGAAGDFTDLEASYVCCCDAWPHKYACRRWTNFTSVHSKLINWIVQRNIVLETQEKSGQVGQRKATGEDWDLINSLSICILRFS